MGALTVAVVTRPFGFEGKRRMMQAERGMQELLESVDTLIVIPNEKLLAVAKDAGFFESFRIADDVLRQGVQGISDIITIPGVINRDFADVKTTMAGMGYAVMGTATRSGSNRAVDAAIAAMASPLLEAGAIDGARGILINITGSSSLKLTEVNEASTIIQNAAHEDANIIFGAVLDERMGDEVKITVIATGFKQEQPERRERMLAEANLPTRRFDYDDVPIQRSAAASRGALRPPAPPHRSEGPRRLTPCPCSRRSPSSSKLPRHPPPGPLRSSRSPRLRSDRPPGCPAPRRSRLRGARLGVPARAPRPPSTQQSDAQPESAGLSPEPVAPSQRLSAPPTARNSSPSPPPSSTTSSSAPASRSAPASPTRSPNPGRPSPPAIRRPRSRPLLGAGAAVALRHHPPAGRSTARPASSSWSIPRWKPPRAFPPSPA